MEPDIPVWVQLVVVVGIYLLQGGIVYRLGTLATAMNGIEAGLNGGGRCARHSKAIAVLESEVGTLKEEESVVAREIAREAARVTAHQMKAGAKHG